MMIGWWFVQGLYYPVRYYLGILGSYHNPWKRNPYQQTGIYLNHGCSNLLQVNDSKGVEGKFGECTSLLNWPPLVSGAFFLHPQVAVCRMRFAPSSMVASWGWYEFSIQQKTLHRVQRCCQWRRWLSEERFSMLRGWYDMDWYGVG